MKRKIKVLSDIAARMTDKEICKDCIIGMCCTNACDKGFKFFDGCTEMLREKFKLLGMSNQKFYPEEVTESDIDQFLEEFKLHIQEYRKLREVINGRRMRSA
jgi:hypothetical protein